MARSARASDRCYLTDMKFCGTLLLLALAAGGSAQAEVYKWVDKTGQTHYAEHPPAGVKYDVVNPSYAQPILPSTAQTKGAPVAGQTQVEPKKAEQEQEAVKIRMQNCLTVQKRLDEYQSAPRLRIQNPDGSVQRLSDEERQARIDETLELIKKYCD